MPNFTVGQQPQFRGGENELFKALPHPKAGDLSYHGQAVLAFERVTTYLSLFSHNPTRWEEEKTHCELYISALDGFYNNHGPNTVLALERAATDNYHCPITSPSHLGGGENFLSPIHITV